MYKGVYWPSLTNSFHSKHLEMAYLRYTHRQRQKSLIIVNMVDFLLKVPNQNLFNQSDLQKVLHFQVALFVLWAASNSKPVVEFMSNRLDSDAIIWSICCMAANIAVCILGWWRCFANNYLHWAAVCTWILLNVQGRQIPCSY